MTTAAQKFDETTTPDHRPSRRSTLLLAATVLIGIVLLLWGADRLARWGAQTVLAGQIEARTGVLTRPQVEVNGPFFLVQMVRGRYDDVDVTVEGLGPGPLRIQRLQAELVGVRLSFHALLTRDTVPIYIESTREQALLRYEDLNSYLEATGRSVRLESAPDGAARLTGSIRILGQEVSASAQAGLAAQDGRISVRPTQLDTGTGLDRASRLLLQQRFSFSVPLDPLPFGQRLTAIDPQDSGLMVTARGSGVLVQP